MARLRNELFIGADKLNIEGRSIKHPALIKEYSNISTNKLRDTPISLIAIDLETDHKTAELKLIGFWNGKKYIHVYKSDFLQVLFTMVKYCSNNDISLAYWNRLDPYVLYKQFLLEIDTNQQEYSLNAFSKIGGEWNKKQGKWNIPPVIEIEIRGYKFGIKNAIRSCVQFYYRKEGSKYINSVWAYDIAQLYEYSLEREALGVEDKTTHTYPNARLPYYSKGDESLHKINWNRFELDLKFKSEVLKSNELDARACYDLGNAIQEEFFKAFRFYPKNLISQGSLARSSIVALLSTKYHAEKDNLLTELKSIPLINYKEEWTEKYGADFFKDVYCLIMESYSGGYIEAIRYGYCKEGYIADITSAYPAIISQLYDLRNAKLTTGKGEPPHIPFSYCFVRGTVHIPDRVQFHPITIKHPINKDTNIRAVGDYIASYSIEDRDFLLELGASFENETWYNIETTGKLSPIATTCKAVFDLRMTLKLAKNPVEYTVKRIIASYYGIEFEAVDTYEMFDNIVYRAGYRGGEFLNPLYSSIITDRVRLQLSRCANHIEKNGGKVILLMTDSIIWNGNFDLLPKEEWRETKTLGFFEKPEAIYNIVCLGSGRYEYSNSKGKFTAKKRGLNVSELHNPSGAIVNDFNWLKLLKVMRETGSTNLKVKVRTLVSVGLLLNNHSFKVDDLGRIIEEVREVEAVVGRNKREYNEEELTPEKLSTELIDTKCIHLGFGMDGTPTLNDQTLPELRSLLMKKSVKSMKSKIRSWNSTSVNNYREKNKNTLQLKYKHQYAKLKAIGCNIEDCKRMRYWSEEMLRKELGNKWK